MATFASEFVRALPTGIDLADRMDRQRKTSAAKELGEIMAEMQAVDPGSMQDNPAQQGMPEPGQTAAKNPIQGYSGGYFNELSNRYFKAAAGLGDVRDYGAAMATYGEFRKNRINESIDGALASLDQGDTNGAAGSLRKASAFMTPGTTPEITHDPNSGAFVVANYKDGKPTGGYALTRENLMDIRGRNTDYMAWAQIDERKQEHKDNLGLAYAKFNHSKAVAGAAASRAAAAAGDAHELNAQNIALRKLQVEQAGLDLETGIRTQEGKVAAANAKAMDEMLVSAQGEADRHEKEVKAAVTEDADELMKLAQYPTVASKPVPPGEAAGTAMPEGGVPDDGNMAPADQLGWFEATVGTSKKTTAVDPWYFTPPDAQGVSTLKPEMLSMGARITRDILDPTLNPDGSEMPKEQRASLIESAIGRSGNGQLMTGKDEDGNAYARLTEGVESVYLSPQTYGTLYNYRRAYAEELEARTGRNPHWLPEQGPPAPEADAAGALPSPATAPGAPVPAGAFPGSAPAPAIPEPAVPGAPMGAANAAPPPPVDETVAQAPNANAQAPSGVVNGPAPPANQAIMAWMNAGKPMQGPEYDSLTQALDALDPTTRRNIVNAITQ